MSQEIVRLKWDNCFYCKVPIYKTFVPDENGNYLRHLAFGDCLTKDHAVPKSKGGSKTVASCHKCNMEKRDMTVNEFRESKMRAIREKYQLQKGK